MHFFYIIAGIFMHHIKVFSLVNILLLQIVAKIEMMRKLKWAVITIA